MTACAAFLCAGVVDGGSLCGECLAVLDVIDAQICGALRGPRAGATCAVPGCKGRRDATPVVVLVAPRKASAPALRPPHSLFCPSCDALTARAPDALLSALWGAGPDQTPALLGELTRWLEEKRRDDDDSARRTDGDRDRDRRRTASPRRRRARAEAAAAA